MINNNPPRRYQFYGRRKGHALHTRQARLMDEVLPRFRFTLEQLDRNKSTWLEIGFGGGEHLAHQAALHPDIAFIGAEPFINGVAKLVASIEDRALANIRIHDDDARFLLEALPDASLDRVYLLYPDPWPKARHHRRRFVSAENLCQFHRLLKPGGLFLFASDIPDYVDWTRQAIATHGGFATVSDTADPFENWLQTRYEAKARREGRSSVYLTYRSRPRP